jgi:hypothetical protein
MKLSDLRNVVDGKLPNYRDVASGLDDTLIRLLVVALLPFVACMVILRNAGKLKCDARKTRARSKPKWGFMVPWP